MPNSERSKTNLLFSDAELENPIIQRASLKSPFKILIVDDEEEVHRLTKMVLKDYVFEGRSLQFLNAFSGGEARSILEATPDIAVVLLDVVMETDFAGLELVKVIRKELNNSLIRIILRTGQPGQAPEKEIIINYDINDYKEKSELTSRKLFTAITSALRSYRDLVTIDNNRKGLRTVIEATTKVFEPQSLSKLTQGVLQQLNILVNVNNDSSFIHASSFAAMHSPRTPYSIISATGRFSFSVDMKLEDVLPNEILRLILQIEKSRNVLIDNDRFIGYFETSNGMHNIIFVEGLGVVNELDRDILKLFSNNVAVAFDNLFLNKEIVDTQKSVVYMLGEVVERRSKETGNHVRRMTEVSCVIGEALGLSEQDIGLLRLGAPMHDIGKIAISDSILHKPGKFTAEEFEIMKTHTTEGYNILKGSDREALRIAAIIAYQHHEKWDGSGYSQGLSGEDIHLFARIVALADVVDALHHKRCYKEAWSFDKILELINNERGKHFDPLVVDVFLQNLDKYEMITKMYV